jgi:hypothetical protein
MKLTNLSEASESGGSSEHSCPIKYKKAGDEDWFRRNRNKCQACDEAYESSLDLGFLDEPSDYGGDEDESSTLGQQLGPGEGMGLQDWVKSLADRDPRKHHKAGEFGTGSPQAIKSSDAPVPALLKFVRDYNIPVDPVTGEAKRADVKSRCGFGHTCHSSPGKHPAWQYPLPDPLRTEAMGAKVELETEQDELRRGLEKLVEREEPLSADEELLVQRVRFRLNELRLALFRNKKPSYRFNKAFYYDVNSTRTWPVSGLNGFEPKEEYRDYVESKLSCPVCTGKDSGCQNQVSQQYGVPKPFCAVHIAESPYIKNLMRQLEDEPLSADEDRRVAQWENAAEAIAMGVGDRVWRGFGPSRKLGTVVDVDHGNAPKILGVQWDNDSAPVYEVPEKLNMWGPHVKGHPDF